MFDEKKEKSFVNFMTNRFVVYFEDKSLEELKIPIEWVVSFFDDNCGTITVRFRDTNKFYAPEFFSDKKGYTWHVVVKLLDEKGCEQASNEYSGVKLVRLTMPKLNYLEDGENMTTGAVFTYNNATYSLV